MGTTFTVGLELQLLSDAALTLSHSPLPYKPAGGGVGRAAGVVAAHCGHDSHGSVAAALAYLHASRLRIVG